jgi:DNA-binding CsgD family transcriptional regulator/pimeloyl-ACP methyl ester carboxylesterase
MSIAWTAIGSGPPLINVGWARYFSHPLFSDLFDRFNAIVTRTHRLILYDGRGTGLSDRNFSDITIETMVEDVASVAAAAGADRLAIFAAPQGALPAIVYAARYPERVSRMILSGGYAVGRPQSPAEEAKRNATIAAFEVGWDDPNPAYRYLQAKLVIPTAPPDETEKYTEYLRVCYSGRQLANVMRAVMKADVTLEATQVRCPTLVTCSRGAANNAFEASRTLAGLIPGARFVPNEGQNSVSFGTDPEWPEAMRHIHEFLVEDVPASTNKSEFCALTPRERDVLELLAQGLDNLQIAAHLDLHEKTVRNHITPIFDKLGVENRSQAIVKAREAGLGTVRRSDQSRSH